MEYSGAGYTHIGMIWNMLCEVLQSIVEYTLSQVVEYSGTNPLSDLVELGNVRNTIQCRLTFCTRACTYIFEFFVQASPALDYR